MNPIYEIEINKLANLLDKANIPYDMRELWGGWQIGYPNFSEDNVSDVVCHDFSYGHEVGLLEMMGLVNEEEVGDTVEGWLTAEEVFERWQNHYSLAN